MAAFLMLALAGCSNTGPNAIWQQTAQDLWGRPSASRAELAQMPAPTERRSLRASLGQGFFFFTHIADQADYSLWVSPAGELLRLSPQGRIVGSSGSWYADWRQARNSATPSWGELAQAHQAGRSLRPYLRIRDVAPGGHANVRELIDIRAIAPPPQPAALLRQQAADLLWFEESSLLHDPHGHWASWRASQAASQDPMARPLPPARFALARQAQGGWALVYSEQCLAAGVCFSLEAWPAAAPAQP